MGPKIFLNRTSVLKLLQFHSITVLSQLGRSYYTCAELWASIRLRAAIYLVNHINEASKGQIILKGLFGILRFFQKTNEQIRF